MSGNSGDMAVTAIAVEIVWGLILAKGLQVLWNAILSWKINFLTASIFVFSTMIFLFALLTSGGEK